MSLSLSLYTIASLLLFAAAAVLLAVQTVLALGTGAVIAVYMLLLLSFVMLALSSRGKKQYGKSFLFESHENMKFASYALAAGFVAETVSNLIQLYEYYTSDTIVFGRAAILIITAVFALLSAFTAVLSGLSYGDTKYDFKRLPAICFVPLVWSMLKVGALLGTPSSPLQDSSSAVKAILALCVMFFFYRFGAEALKNENASPFTVFFSGAVFYAGLLFFVLRLTLVITQQAELLEFDNLFSLTALTIALFAFFFRHNIVKTS